MYQLSGNRFRMKDEEQDIRKKFMQFPHKSIHGEEELRCPQCGRVCVISHHEVFSEVDDEGSYSSVTRYECR